MIILVLIFLIVLLSVGYVHWVQKYSRKGKLIAKFPSAGPYVPVLGLVWDFSRNLEELYLQFKERNGRFRETFNFWAGPYPNLNVVTADDAEIILSSQKHIDKGITYYIFDKWLKTGLLTSTGKKWHQRRRMLTPSFHYNILQEFVEVFGEQSEKLTEMLTKKSDEEKVVDIKPIITLMTLSTICETSMGCKLDQANKYLNAYCENLHRFATVFVERVIRPELYTNLTYCMSLTYWQERSIVKYLKKFTSDIIKTRQKTFKVEHVENMETNGSKRKQRLAMLDLLLHSKHLNEIDDAGIQEEVDTFVFEGHDTTTASSCLSLLLFAKHQDVQEKIIEELDEIFENSDRRATYDDLQNMKYLERCLKESLRLYPSVPSVVRHIQEDIQFTHHLAPAGSDVWINIFELHRDPKYFPDPEKFDPDRFLPENLKGRHPYAYVPFSAGPRNCIGQKFAMLELKSMVSSILRKFRMEPVLLPEEVIFSYDVVLRTQRPIHIKFIPRN